MPWAQNIHVYTQAPASTLVMANGSGTLTAGPLGTAITGLNGTLQSGQAILVGTTYGVCVGPATPTNPPTPMLCTQHLPAGWNLSTN